MISQDYYITGTRKYKVHDNNGKVIYTTTGKQEINSITMNPYDARDIAWRVSREMEALGILRGVHCIHQIGDKIYFDAITME